MGIGAAALLVRGQNAVQPVRTVCDQSHDADDAQGGKGRKDLAWISSQKKRDESDEQDDHGRAQILAQHHESQAQEIQNRQGGVCPQLADLTAVFLRPVQGRRKPYAQGELHHLGRLHREHAALADPAGIAVDLDAERRERQQLQQHRE